jgi:hypothetical protein
MTRDELLDNGAAGGQRGIVAFSSPCIRCSGVGPHRIERAGRWQLAGTRRSSANSVAQTGFPDLVPVQAGSILPSREKLDQAIWEKLIGEDR